MIDKPREIALKVLYKVDKYDAYSNIALDEEIQNNRKNLNERDIGLISEIVYGTTSWKLTIDEIIKKYSKIKFNKISLWILNILRMGIYQIVFLDKVPKSAAVNESVNLAKRYGHKTSSNFVNAILRKIEKEDYNEICNVNDGDRSQLRKISLKTSMPIWIIEKLLEEKTLEEVEEICENCNKRPSISIRINKLKTNKEDVEKELKKQNIIFSSTVLDEFIEIKNVKNIENLEIFKKGFFTIQDEAAGLVAIILDAKKGDKILDACSAPGGKTTFIAEMMENQGEIQAWDIYEHRIQLINNTARRLGITIIDTKVKDATKYEKTFVEKFDKILLDVPCMGLGVIKRKPDIKWKKNIDEIKKITSIQNEILQICSKYLKNGGDIIYSTCSILKEENEEIINNFLENNKEFQVEPINLSCNNYFCKYMSKYGYLKVYPNEKTDGFFICKIKKK